ncbi:MAG: transcriptional activator domain-containing protein [Actinomycetota bacterium]|nr:transcriptional activator domain-containing protein [Actinomycetota bacterium]
MEQRCEIRLVGGFEVIVDGSRVSGDSWRSRRAADLVKLLALETGHRLHREQVMESLWPDLAVDAAAANLRKAIHYARRAMGSEDAIRTDGALLMLWPTAAVEIDLDRFLRESEEALSSGDRERCRRLAGSYSGVVLPGDRYEVWSEEPQERVRARRLALLKRAGEWERVLELDETDEEAHRALMEAHLTAGNRREAIRQFERLRGALREHIGVGPDPTTVRLYERVLALEGPETQGPAERTAALLANALVLWSRGDLIEADRLAREARSLALSAELGHELGQASGLLALIAYARGRWNEVFKQHFAHAVGGGGPAVESAVYDAHLCFQEFYLYGPQGHAGGATLARELLAMATAAASAGGMALAMLLLGECELLSGKVDEAVASLEMASRYAGEGACVSPECIGLERLAEAEVARENRDRARDLLERARPLAESSHIRSHLLVRLLAIKITAAEGHLQALQVALDAERALSDAPRVCEPCSMNFHIEAARAFARAGELSRARRRITEAERIAGLWQTGPWTAAVWEARAELRRAEGEGAQAVALFREAAESFAGYRRPIDEARCRALALTPV